MKKFICTLMILFISLTAFAQDYGGTLATGVQSYSRLGGTPPETPENLLPPAPESTFAFTSNEVGTTEGQLTVSLTGSANYSIPIAVPPGINGVVPQLELAYNSQGDNGLAGYGWDLTGISMINIVAKSKFNAGIGCSYFALDGQRLMEKDMSDTSHPIYETENFSNIKITYISSALGHYKVEYPDGSFAFYGGSNDSETSTGYAITYWQNAQGVSITYHYIKTFNKLLISSIKYGSRLSTPGINEIQFVYADRIRPEVYYSGGASITKDKILTDIIVLGNGSDYRKYSLIHETTNLNYQRLIKITEKSGIGFIKEYNPTAFTYTDTPDNITFGSVIASTTVNDTDSQNSETVSGDFDGDGKLDFILYRKNGPDAYKKYWVFNDISNGSLFDYSQTFADPFSAIIPISYLSTNNNTDYKLLPKQGWCIVKKNAAVTNFDCSSWSPEGILYHYTRSYTFPQYNNLEIPKKYISGDFNGDGLTDIIAINVNDGGATSSQAGKAYLVNLDRRLTDSNAVTYLGIFAENTFVGDYDGDGKSDLYIFTPGKVTVLGIDNNAYSYFAGFTNPNITTNTSILLGDYNGDGKTDIIIPKGSGYSEWYKFTSTGSLDQSHTFVAEIQTYDQFYYAADNSVNKHYYIAADYNNDGKTDILTMTCMRDSDHHWGKVSLICYLNKNGTFSRTANNYYPKDSGAQTNLTQYALPIFLTSDKSNRSLEIGFIQDNMICNFKSQKDFNKERLLKTITTGNGVSQIITYKPLVQESINNYSSPNVYTPNSNAIENYPNIDIISLPTFNVVSKLELKSADVNKKQFYTYYGATYSMDGLGFLGFRGTMQTNWIDATHNMISSVSRYDVGLRGAITENFSVINFLPFPNTTPTSGYLSKSITTYNIDNTTGSFEQPLQLNNVFKLKKTKVEEFNGLEGTSNTTTTDYDPYNNPTKITTITKEGANVVKSNVDVLGYENLPTASSYVIGRLKSKMTTATIYPGQADQDVFSTEELYDYQNCQLSQIKRKGNNAQYYIIEDNLFDPLYGNLTQKTISAPNAIPPPTPRTTHYEYDPTTNRFMTKSYDVENLLTTYTYDSTSGNLLTVTNPYLLTTTYSYDDWNKKTRTLDNYLQKGVTYNYARSNEKTIITTTGDDDSTSEIILDDLGRKIRSGVKDITGNWSYVSYEYDLYNRITKVSEPYSTSPSLYNETQYDGLGRISKTISYTTKTNIISYPSGLTTTVNDGIKSKSSIKNALGNVISITDTPGGTITYKYFANGNLKSANYGSPNTTVSIEQDEWGRKKKLTDPTEGTLATTGIYKYEYNIFGEMTKEITPKGTTNYNIDDFGKITSKTIIGDLTNSVITNTYDGTTKLLDSSLYQDNIGNTTTNYVYKYDPAQRLWKTTETGTQAIFERTTTYDGYGRPDIEKYKATSISDGNTSSISTKNNYLNGYLWQIVDSNNNMLWQIDEVNQRGQLVTAQYGNAVGIEKHFYDQKGFPASTTFKTQNGSNASNVPFMELTTVFDDVRGNLNNRTNKLFSPTEAIETFGFDPLDRLTSYPNESGTVVDQSYTDEGKIDINNLGKYIYPTSKNIYQNTGIKITDPTVFLYYKLRTPQVVSYNAFKRPVTITEANTEKIDFEYNAFGNRSVMYYGGLQSNKNSRPLQKYYAFDGSMEIKKDIPSNTTEFVTYIGGDGYSAPAIFKSVFTNGSNTDNTFYYLHRDYQGSILAITNPAGLVVEKRKFDAWGQLIKLQDGQGNDLTKFAVIDRGYTGHEHLLGVGLINMNGRLYDPKLHRFFSPDNNIQDPYNTQNYNRYSYVLNNPLKYTDPTGENSTDGNGDCNCNGGPEIIIDDSNLFASAGLYIRDHWDGWGIKDWSHNAFNLNHWNTNFKSASNWLENNINSIGDFVGNNIGSFFDKLGLGGSGDDVLKPAGSYSFASNYNSANYVSSHSVMPEIGYNNGVEIHPFASINSFGQLGDALTFQQARLWYQFGRGARLNVNINSIDFSKVSMADFNNRGLATIRLDGKHFSNANDAMVHGTITLQLVGNSNLARVALNSDPKTPQLNGKPAGMYDFEMHSWGNPINWFRNPETLLGGFINGLLQINIGGMFMYVGGTPFPIYYYGTIKVKP